VQKKYWGAARNPHPIDFKVTFGTPNPKSIKNTLYNLKYLFGVYFLCIMDLVF